MKMKKEDLTKYQIICTNGKEAKECMDMLKKLGFAVHTHTKYEDYNCIIRYTTIADENYFWCGDILCSDCKNINFYQFKKLYKKLIKQEPKDFEVNNKGQIIKINNYNSNETVYVIDYIDYDTFIDETIIKANNKEFLDKCINIGFIFNTKENIEKFLQYIRNYDKQ